MMNRVYCAKAYRDLPLSKMGAGTLKMHIHQGNHNNWIIADLSFAAIGQGVTNKKQTHYAARSPHDVQGQHNTSNMFLYSHVKIILDYHQPGTAAVESFCVVD